MEWADAQPGDPIDIAVCVCEAGQAYRLAVNERRRTVPMWRVWCAVHQVDPLRVFLLEQIYSAEELRAVGLAAPVEKQSREARILAAAAKVKR